MSLNALLKLADRFERKINKYAQRVPASVQVGNPTPPLSKSQQYTADPFKSQREVENYAPQMTSGDTIPGKVVTESGYDKTQPGGNFEVQFKADVITPKDIPEWKFDHSVREMQEKLMKLAEIAKQLTPANLMYKIKLSPTEIARLSLAPHGADGKLGNNTYYAMRVADKISAALQDPFGMNLGRRLEDVKANINTLNSIIPRLLKMVEDQGTSTLSEERRQSATPFKDQKKL
jgi:hypothetical protein